MHDIGKWRKAAAALAAAAMMLAVAPGFAANDLSGDLTSTLALLGLPCGKVVSSKRLGENDYLAVCSNGSRYRVFVNEKGRVVARKQ